MRLAVLRFALALFEFLAVVASKQKHPNRNHEEQPKNEAFLAI